MTNRTHAPRRCFPARAALLLLLAAAGCGKPVGKVSGKVTLQEKPLPGGYVTFLCEGPNAQTLSSPIQPDGGYSISNVPVGKVKITVQGVPRPVVPRNPADPKAAAPTVDVKREEVRVPPRYSTAEQSGLELDVHSGSQPFDIKLQP